MDLLLASVIGITNPLVKNGPGTMALTGASTYTGSTTINSGTLLVNGSISTGGVAVNSGATLGGTGNIGGAVTVNGGATLRVNPVATGVSKWSTRQQPCVQFRRDERFVREPERRRGDE